MKTKQLPNIPAIHPCAKCGSAANLIDWDFRGRWAVICDKCPHSNNECNTQHRAVSRWNKKQDMILSMKGSSNEERSYKQI